MTERAGRHVARIERHVWRVGRHVARFETHGEGTGDREAADPHVRLTRGA